MNYLTFAGIVALLGIIPLLARLRFKSAVIQFAMSLLILWAVFYASSATFFGPLFGFGGFAVFICWCMATIADWRIEYTGKPTWIIAFPVAQLVIFLGVCVFSSGAMRDDDYSKLIGPVEERIWTQDVQPKDPAKIRMGTAENALFVAQNTPGQLGTIGSQFELEKTYVTLQSIKGELWYLIPFDFRGYSTWTATDGKVPAYVKVNAHDPNQKPVVVELPKGKELQYTPEACFEKNLQRHLRMHGYLMAGLTDYSFESDDEGNVWWIITTYELTIGNNGRRVTGILMVDPATGDIKAYPKDKVPGWVDRVIPQEFVKNNITYWGKYVHGWRNSWWGTKDLVKPEDPDIVYGTDGHQQWVTGVTSTSKDTSLVGVMYTDSHTGKSVYYKAKGGATDAAVLKAVNANNQVQYRKLHAASPQMYNIYGVMTDVVILLNEQDAFQGAAFVDINNVQTGVAVGADQFEAMQAYQGLLSAGGHRIAVDKAANALSVSGVVSRIHHEPTTGGEMYYVLLRGIPHLFNGESRSMSALRVTEPGDKVTIEYLGSNQDVTPIRGFKNNSISLQSTKAQQDVSSAERAARDAQDTSNQVDTAKERINSLTPEQILELSKKLPEKK